MKHLKFLSLKNEISIIEIVKLLKNRNMPTKFLHLPARGESQKLAKSSQRILWMAPDLKFRFASHQTYNIGGQFANIYRINHFYDRL